jgi:glycosyltransferase involved in cell wall biosynthesis
MDEICILLASLNRPERLKTTLLSLQETAPGVKVVVALDSDDQGGEEVARKFGVGVVICPENRKGPAYAWNTALRASPLEQEYALASDDAIFHPMWLEAARWKLFELGMGGLVGFNDGVKRGDAQWSTHYLMTRDFISEYQGGVAAVPHYRTWCVDTEACERARRARRYIWASDARVDHDWHGNDPDADETYRKARQYWQQDKDLFKYRQSIGFPDDFEAIIPTMERQCVPG